MATLLYMHPSSLEHDPGPGHPESPAREERKRGLTGLQRYRRLAGLEEARDVEAFAAELIDRFGPLPEPTEQLLQLVNIKQFCRKAGVDKVEAGPKGILIGFRQNRFARPERLVGYIAENARRMNLRPDHRLVIGEETRSPEERLKRVRHAVEELTRLAA